MTRALLLHWRRGKRIQIHFSRNRVIIFPLDAPAEFVEGS